MMRSSRFSMFVAAAAVPLLAASASMASTTVFANFEDGTTDGFGNLNPANNTQGVVPFGTGGGNAVAGSVVVPTSGNDTTNVLQLVAPGYNGGQSNGSDLGYDFVASGTAAEFMANDILTFQFEAPAGSTAGYTQLYSISLSAPGLGYVTVGGVGASEGTDSMDNEYSYSGYTGSTVTYTLNYDQYKSQISANPGYLQLGITTNDGGGAPTDIYFDNFALSTASVPEPASLGLMALAMGGTLIRRRRA